MCLYILVWNEDYESFKVIGAFDSEEKAILAMCAHVLRTSDSIKEKDRESCIEYSIYIKVLNDTKYFNDVDYWSYYKDDLLLHNEFDEYRIIDPLLEMRKSGKEMLKTND